MQVRPPGSGRFPGGGNGNPLQYSCLRNPMDRGAWQAAVQRIAELDTTEQLAEHVVFKYIRIVHWDFVVNFAFEKKLYLSFFLLTPLAKESEASLGSGVSPSLFSVTWEGEVKGRGPAFPEIVRVLRIRGCHIWRPVEGLEEVVRRFSRRLALWSGSIPLTHQQQHQYWMLSFRCRPGALNTLFTCETCIQQTCRGSCMILTLQTRKLEPRKINAVSTSLPRSSWMEFYLRFSHSRRNATGKAPADQKPPNPTTPVDFMNFDL